MNSNPPLLWAALLVLTGLVLMVFEAFVPSAGVLTVLSIGSLIAGVFFAYMASGMLIGTLFFGGTMVLSLGLLALLVRIWPHTPLGKRMMSKPPVPDATQTPQARLAPLVGRFGVARSLMLPSGIIEVEGQSFDAVSQGGSIEKGSFIRVQAVRGRELIVKEVEADSVPQQAETTAHVAPPGEIPVLDPFADDLPLEELEEPSERPSSDKAKDADA